MGRSIPPLVFALLALCAASREARADAEMTVTRGDGAQACPDATELRRIANASRPPAATTHVYRVSFEHTGGSIRAEIVDETAKRIRTLVDHGSRCAPLGDAVAMVLATMWSSEQAEDAPEPPLAARIPTPPVASPHDEVAPPASFVQSKPTYWIASAGGGVTTGIVRTVAPALMADIAVERSFFAIALGALWIPEQTLDLSPGAVHVQLLAGNLGGCAFLGHGTRAGLCARFFAGALRANGTGYDVSSHETRPWVAGGLDIFLGGALPIKLLRYRLSAGVIVPIHAEAFSVAGVGTAYETPAVGGLFTLAIELAAPSR